jgi:two-component system alkaline phosphatase synthesis response regulator PhoP
VAGLIYYIEDDAHIRELVSYSLKQSGYELVCFAEGPELIQACKDAQPDVVMVDIMLPGMDGLEILRVLRSEVATKHVPVIMLSAKGTEADKVEALDAGADDYLAKPFGLTELNSRVKALLRRAYMPATGSSERLINGEIELDVTDHTVTVGGKLVHLTLKEFDLLYILMANAGRIMDRVQLFENVWETSFVGNSRTVDVHVRTLRQKLDEACPGSDGRIQTVRGMGYMMQAAAQ